MSSPIGSSNGNGLPQVRPWWRVPDNPSNVIPVKEACTKYHYCRASIIRKIKTQQLQGFKFGRRWYVIETKLRENTRKRNPKKPSS